MGWISACPLPDDQDIKGDIVILLARHSAQHACDLQRSLKIFAVAL
jgi:hypothetical protein